jgi:GT2 family glycosyltransferase
MTLAPFEVRANRTQVSQEARPTISVIIVSWNVCDHLRCCLEALDRSDIGDLDIIVVDNDSSDSTRDVIPREFPHVRFIPLSSNVGFPAANNVALPLARGTFVLLLNPDTEVAPDCLRRCVDAFDRDPGIGMVGCRLVSPSGDIQYECACNMPSIVDAFGEALYLNVLLPRHRLFGRLRMSYWDHASDRYVPRICGAFMMLRTDLLRELGGLDERFFMYYEDLDLCARVGREREILYLASATTIHHGGRSRAKSTRDLEDLAPAIRYTFYQDHRGKARAELFRACMAIQSVLRLGIAGVIVALVPRSSPLRRTRAAQPRIHWTRLQWCLGLIGDVDGYRTGGDVIESGSS